VNSVIVFTGSFVLVSGSGRHGKLSLIPSVP